MEWIEKAVSQNNLQILENFPEKLNISGRDMVDLCEVECCGVGDGGGKSQKPLYSKLENLPELKLSLLFQFCDCCFPTLQQRSSQVWVRKEGLLLSGESGEEIWWW